MEELVRREVKVLLPPLVADGIAYGSGLALLACGITLIYMTTKTFNFAHASMCTWGLFVIYTGNYLLGFSPYVFFPLAFVLGAGQGIIWYIICNRYLLRRNADETVLMMSTLGYELLLLSLVQMFADVLTQLGAYPRLITMSSVDFQIFGMRAITVLSLISAITILATLHLYLTRTRFGLAIRATVENTSLAGVTGINSEKVYLTAWFLGGGLAGLGGAFIGMVSTGSPVLGWGIIVPMFAASILGGLYSIYGGIVGGYIVGLVEYVGLALLAIIVGVGILPYRPVLPLAIMVIVLLVLPQGLAGLTRKDLKKIIEKDT
ncbi:MAG: branched-chain amino acid ABC transporter permease, partial [Candidatus Thorarchaeota archaeon]